MQVTILGIVGDTIYIEPFYAGDYAHELTISKYEKADFIKHGAVEYPSYSHIEAQLHGMSHDEYIKYVDAMRQREEFMLSIELVKADDNSLPF